MKNELGPAQPAHTREQLEAIEWFIRLKDAELDSHDRKGARRKLLDEYWAWANTSPDHPRAFEETAACFYALGEELRRQSDLAHLIGIPVAATPPTQRRPIRELLTAAAVVCATVVIALALWPWSKATTYSTSTGERRSVTLADGSLVHLNAQSTIRVWYSRTQRGVTLIGGEVLFDVQPDPRRPFKVRTDTTEIRVLGTEFNVYQRYGPARVAVVRGSIQVSAYPGTSAAPLTLFPGDVVDVEGQTLAKEANPDVDDIVAWPKGELVADHMTVAAAAAELNLNNSRQLKIVGDKASQKRITGTFATNRPDVLAELLEGDPDLSVRADDDGWIVEARQ